MILPETNHSPYGKRPEPIDETLSEFADRTSADRNLLTNWYHKPEERGELANKLAKIRSEMRQRKIPPTDL